MRTDCVHAVCLAGPASVLRARLVGAELPAAVLLVPGSGVRRTPPPHHRSFLLPPGEAQTHLPGAQTHLPLRRSLQVRRVAAAGRSGAIVTCRLMHSHAALEEFSA